VDAGIRESGVPQPNIERFDCICHHAGIDSAKSVKLFGTQDLGGLTFFPSHGAVPFLSAQRRTLSTHLFNSTGI
jgi:hypothetical protein